MCEYMTLAVTFFEKSARYTLELYMGTASVHSGHLWYVFSCFQ